MKLKGKIVWLTAARLGHNFQVYIETIQNYPDLREFWDI